MAQQTAINSQDCSSSSDNLTYLLIRKLQRIKSAASHPCARCQPSYPDNPLTYYFWPAPWLLMLRAARLILSVHILIHNLELVTRRPCGAPAFEEHTIDLMISISSLEPWLHPEIRQQLKNRSHGDVISAELLNSCLRIATANQIIKGFANRLSIKEKRRKINAFRLLMFSIF